MKHLILLAGILSLGFVGLALAADTSTINPLCAAFDVANKYWDLIKILVVGIVGIIVLIAAAFHLIAGKIHWTFILIVGGTVILLIAWQVMGGMHTLIQNSQSACQQQS